MPAGVLVTVGVAVGGIGVAVGVGGTRVAVGVGGTGVAVGASVLVGGGGIGVGVAVGAPHAVNVNTTNKVKPTTRKNVLLWYIVASPFNLVFGKSIIGLSESLLVVGVNREGCLDPVYCPNPGASTDLGSPCTPDYS